MAFRFRRSVKLGKGIKLNVSKRGVGMSFGTTGLRQSFHSTGQGTQTIGIPGTGLSYVKRRNLPKKQTRKRKQTRQQPSTSQDASQNEAAVVEFYNYLHAITHLHLDAPKEIDWETLSGKPAPFEPGEIGPREAEAVAELDEYEPHLFARLLKPLANKQRKQLQQAVQKARERDTKELDEWEKWKELSKAVQAGQADAYQQAIKENPEFNNIRKRGMLLKVSNNGAIEVDLQVTPKEVIPNQKLKLTKTGKVSKRKMGKKEYYRLTKDFVCSYVLWVSRALFASLPVESCIIHVTENALNTATGHRKNKVLLSVMIERQTLNQLNWKHIDPSEAMGNFTHRINHLKTKGFREVERLS